MILLPLPPKNKSERTIIVKGRRIPNREYSQWREAVILWLRCQKLPYYDKGARLALMGVFELPDLRARDLENAVSGLQDCMTGVVYRDDSQIFKLVLTKRLDRTLKEPRLWFEIMPLEDPQ